jgi:hypothetical protein
MTRLKREDLQRKLDVLCVYTRKTYVYGIWNGFYHVYVKSNGEMLVTGSLRECYDYVTTFIKGMEYAFSHVVDI